MLAEDDEIQQFAKRFQASLPVLAVGGGSGEFTPETFRQTATNVTAAHIDGIGHYVAMEVPDRFAETSRVLHQGRQRDRFATINRGLEQSQTRWCSSSPQRLHFLRRNDFLVQVT